MKLRYGILSALLVIGPAVAEETRRATSPEAEKTNITNAAAPEQTGFSRGSVVRSIFTTAVDNREPVDNIKQLSDESKRIYYYTELRDMAGQTAKHRWEFKGEVMAEVEFNVKGPRWRVWSSKNFIPQWTGDWKVSVLNGANEIISEETFTYTADTAAQAMPMQQ